MSSGGPCFCCGKNPAAGFASIWTAKDGQRWYCHGDDDDVSCYETTPQAGLVGSDSAVKVYHLWADSDGNYGSAEADA